MSPYRDDRRARETITIARDWRAIHRAIAFAAGGLAALGGAFLVDAERASRRRTQIPDVATLLTTGRAGDQTRVDGDFVPGSLVHTEGSCEYRFSVESQGFRMPVRLASCVIPDPFEVVTREDEPTPVIVEGELGRDGFAASGVIARIPSCCYCSAKDRAAQLRAWRESRRLKP